MCGIAGYIAVPGHGHASRAAEVLSQLHHRGPDDAGWLACAHGTVTRGKNVAQLPQSADVLLLHRRLAILDLSENGWQPMSTADGRFHIVFNGEIYNYIELRNELQQLGHTFRSNSDTEVLLAAYAQWGTEALRRFTGMFAFALYDSQWRTVTLARDFFGIKPLYYRAENKCVTFGSEIKALIAFGMEQPRANTSRLLSYLRFGLTDFGAETMLEDVMQVPAGHFITIPLDYPVPQAPQCYWSMPQLELGDISFDEAATRVREIFLRNVELHLRSDVPLGCALSGGIDSSAIVMAMRLLDSNAEIHTFSYIAGRGARNEGPWADIIVKASGARAHTITVSSEGIPAELGKLMHLHDEPFGSTSALAQYLVFQAAAREGIKVMLDGQGADEIFGGYVSLRGARLASLFRDGRFASAMSVLHGAPHGPSNRWQQQLAYCADYLVPPALQNPVRRLIGKQAYPAWLNRRWFADRGAEVEFSNYVSGKQVLRDSLRRSLTMGLPSLLRYEDRNSMAFSIESRVPFLTPELATFVTSLPEQYLIDQQGTSKAVFRKAMRGIVPDAILDRRDKVGFETPERDWLSSLNGWVKDTLSHEATSDMLFLNLPAAHAEADAVSRGSRPFGFHIWRWINLIRWTEHFGVRYS